MDRTEAIKPKGKPGGRRPRESRKPDYLKRLELTHWTAAQHLARRDESKIIWDASLFYKSPIEPPRCTTVAQNQSDHAQPDRLSPSIARVNG